MTLINVSLPDGTVNEYAVGVTCAEVITDALGRKHGCLAARIDGVECDLSRVLDNDCSIEGILSESEDGIHILRHSAAHLLAQAVMALYPGAKPTIGPAIDRGFYYDFSMEQIVESDLKAIQKKMQELARKNFTVERIELTDKELQDHFADNPYKMVAVQRFTNRMNGTIYVLGLTFRIHHG
jgi:threonyl-tRNA synthetase